jgi:PAS domain-containing protein
MICGAEYSNMPEETKTERKPYVAIFGDNKSQRVTKTVWSLLSGYELKLASVDTVAELENIVSDAVLIIVVIQGVNDENIALARRFSHEPQVVADIVALAGDIDKKERIGILANGFDAVYNADFMDYPDFKYVLLNRVEKGFISLENRIQQEEYRRFKAALAASPDAFIVFDQNNKIFFVSEHYQKAYPRSGLRLVRG